MAGELQLDTGQFGGDRWGLAKEADKRFRRLVLSFCLLLVATALWSRLLPPLVLEPEEEEPIERVVQLLLAPPVPEAKPQVEPELPEIVEEPPISQVPDEEVAAIAPPPVIENKVAENNVVEKETPQPRNEPKPLAPPPKSAREQARDAGLLAMQQDLQSLRNADSHMRSASGQLRDDADIARRGLQGPDIDDDAVRADAVRRSAGSQQFKAERVAGPVSDAQLASHVADSNIQRELPSTVASSRPSAAASGRSGRSLEEIQLAFDRNKSAFSAIFSRAARTDGSIDSGAIVVSLTISPSGDVVDCRLVSSSFQNPSLHQRILTRVKMLRFEPKNVPQYTYPSYPINYVRS